MQERPRRLLAFGLLAATFLLAGITLATFAARKFWPLSGAVIALARGRTGICSPAEAVGAYRATASQIALTREIEAGTRAIMRDAAGFQLWETPRGRFWVPGGREGVAFDLAEQARGIYANGETGVKPGDVVLDCGANVGVFTREALRRGAKLVVAIEPGPENIECLRRNFSRETAEGRVIVYSKGVWDREDFLLLSVDPANSARDTFVAALAGSRTVRAPLTTIDKLAQELNLPRVDFIKMDIEGAEQKAVAGAAGVIAKFHPRMALCVYHLPDDPVKIPRRVREIDAGYRSQCGCVLHASNEIQAQVAFFY